MITENYVSFETAKLLKEKGFNVKPFYQYYVSSCGKVFGCKGNEMKQTTTNRGYKRITLSIDGKEERWSVHRLVALLFVPNPDNMPIVNHLDENPMHNFAFNLEWTSRMENFHYGTADERKHRSMLRAVYQCDKDGNIINRFESVYKAGETLGIKPQNITATLTGRQKTCGGFKFFYVTKYDLPDHGFVKKY